MDRLPLPPSESNGPVEVVLRAGFQCAEDGEWAPAAEIRWRHGEYLSREGLLDQALEELDVAAELDASDPVIQMERGVRKR
jgi:hypothetical protein